MTPAADHLTRLERAELTLMDGIQLWIRAAKRMPNLSSHLPENFCTEEFSWDQNEAIASAFDGLDLPGRLEPVREWYALGRRLRRRLRPMPAANLTE